ncbi:MAG: hypothetical protein AABX49_00765 [Nanoarchaeota archaeon]
MNNPDKVPFPYLPSLRRFVESSHALGIETRINYPSVKETTVIRELPYVIRNDICDTSRDYKRD